MATQTDLGKWMITNGGDYDPTATYEQLTMIIYDNSTYITLKTISGITPADDKINYILMAKGYEGGSSYLSSVTADDKYGALGTVGGEVSSQSLVDYLADAVMNKLINKTAITNIQVNDKNKVPSAALAYAMQQEIDKTNSNLVTGEFDVTVTNLAPEKEIAFSTTFKNPMATTPHIFLNSNRDNYVMQIDGVSQNGFSGWMRNIRSTTMNGPVTVYYLAIIS